MSLLQGVLKSQSQTHDLNGQYLSSRQSQPENDSDDELVGVVCLSIPSALVLITQHILKFSLPGTPARSRGPSRPSSRPVSPTRSGLTRTASGLPRGLSSDPLKAFPTQVSQSIFRWLGISELATCASVSRKWNKSQTLNYGKSNIQNLARYMLMVCVGLQVWFQHYRKENFHDESLPPGKWTRRESKQNWVGSLSSCVWLHDLTTRS